jgi:hypothetical protein
MSTSTKSIISTSTNTATTSNGNMTTIGDATQKTRSAGTELLTMIEITEAGIMGEIGQRGIIETRGTIEIRGTIETIGIPKIGEGSLLLRIKIRITRGGETSKE